MFNADYSLAKLPYAIQTYFREEARYLRDDLYHNNLSVVLIPAPRPQFSGHKIRAVQTINPQWYRELYNTIPHFRRDRSIQSLARIIEQQDKERRSNNAYAYDSIYRQLIYDRLMYGYEDELEGYIQPVLEVYDFFNEKSHFL